MGKLAVGIFASMLVASAAGADKNAQDSLATITPGGCSVSHVAPFGTSLLASWLWADGTVQGAFGGDAEFLVEASIDGGGTWQEFRVEFGLVQYEPDSSPEDYAGEMVYRCSNAVSEPAGSCNASVLGLRDALLRVAAEKLGVDPITIGDNIRARLVGVGVKAVNPGKGNGAQNYEKTNVCEADLMDPSRYCSRYGCPILIV